MGYKSTIDITRAEALIVIDNINMNKFTNEGLAQVLEAINDWYNNNGLGHNNYIVKD